MEVLPQGGLLYFRAMPDEQHDLDLKEFLYTFVSEHKRELFEDVLKNRTRHFTVVLENIFQPHNANAVLRTCEILGIQDIHIIEDRNPFHLSDAVTQGSAKWLDLHQYEQKDAVHSCTQQLKDEGYVLACATPHADMFIEELDISKPMAICFGTELGGATEELMDQCDVRFKIPMFGFTESYNISVSAALVLYELTSRVKNSKVDWKLSDMEKEAIRLVWAKRIVHEPDKLERYFDEKRGSDAHSNG